jgi:DNA-binding NtrC family response regulator
MEDAEVSEPAPKPTDGAVIFRPGMTIEEMERLAIRAALAEVHGNRRKAAELLGIGERTLYRKIAKYDLET